MAALVEVTELAERRMARAVSRLEPASEYPVADGPTHPTDPDDVANFTYLTGPPESRQPATSSPRLYDIADALWVLRAAARSVIRPGMASEHLTGRGCGGTFLLCSNASVCASKTSYTTYKVEA